jgi:hypothetical protein
MAHRQSLNTDKYIDDLKQQIKDLKSVNKQLNQKLKMMESVGRRPSQMWASALNRSQQHRRTIKKLEKGHLWVVIGWFLFAVSSIVMVLPILFTYIIRYGGKYLQYH